MIREDRNKIRLSALTPSRIKSVATLALAFNRTRKYAAAAAAGGTEPDLGLGRQLERLGAKPKRRGTKATRTWTRSPSQCCLARRATRCGPGPIILPNQARSRGWWPGLGGMELVGCRSHDRSDPRAATVGIRGQPRWAVDSRHLFIEAQRPRSVGSDGTSESVPPPPTALRPACRWGVMRSLGWQHDDNCQARPLPHRRLDPRPCVRRAQCPATRTRRGAAAFLRQAARHSTRQLGR